MSARRTEIIGDCALYLGDCREVLPGLKGVGAVVTDWPYGIGEAAGKAKTRTSGMTSKVKNHAGYVRDYGDDAWDDEPIPADLVELVMKAGRWNILFGGNYYALPATSCWLVWDKLNGDTDFADCELAWTNLPKAVRRIRYLWNGMMRANRETRGDHPTQKPIGVMRWALSHLPDLGGGAVLDPFMGSGTTGVACVAEGLPFVGVEKIETYFDAACRRIEAAVREAESAPRLFAEPAAVMVQGDLLGGEA